MKKAATQILLLCYVSTFLGCASSQESNLIGKWICKTSGDRMQLSKDRTCTISSMGFEYSGTWTVSKSDIRIEAGQVEMKGSFDGKDIVAEDAVMHNKYVYEKVGETKN
jgi:hypothetical protein